jgi:Carboxypeptidase regulatory-like domain/TonB dependent receptor-like, beta-barrel/TonB-dependent Receptor Plug Domain
LIIAERHGNWAGSIVGRCLLIAILCFVTVRLVHGQSGTATLSGIVIDESGASLPDVRVIAANAATGLQRQITADAEGGFVMRMLPPGRYSVTAERVGFAPAQVKDLLLNANDEVTVRLELKVEAHNEAVSVRVPAGRVSAAAPSTIEVSPLEVRSVAGAGENIYHVLQTLPGVAAVNDFNSRLSVRGGGPDHNLTMMDGVEIHNPYRLFGLTSAFNPETVESFELTAGGFNAKYGDRLSSILVIENRAGTEQQRVIGSANMAFTDGNIVTEGKLPGAASGSWLVTGRRTYYDLIAEPLVGTNLPGFTDVQAKAVWSPRPGQRLTFFGLSSRESTDADIEGDIQGERLQLQSSTHNDLAAVSFSSTIGTRASSKTTVSWYRNRETADFDGDVTNGARRSNRPDADARPFSKVLFTRGVDVRDVAVRQETMIEASAAHLLETGFESHALQTGWGWSITGDRNPNAANGSSVFGGAGLPSSLDSSRSAWRAGAWLTDRWTLTRRLRAEPGLRLDWTGLAGEVVASPRMALVADLDGGMRLRIAGGLFTQSPGYEKLLQSDYFVDLSKADALGLRSERAWHGLVGVERTFGPGLLARAEGYYKRFDRLIVGRLETPDELAARVATYDFPVDLADQRPHAPQITSVPGNDGAGRAFGVELYLARPARSSTDRVNGWLSYSWGRAETTAYGRTYASDYDRPHALSLVANYRVSRLIELGTTVRVQFGFPYSRPVGVRVAAVADTGDSDGDGNMTELIPQRDALGLPVWAADFGDASNLNSGRLPVFARVDLRMTFRPRWQNNRWQLYVEVINLLNRDNAGSLNPELAYDPASDRPRVTTTPDGSLPRLPSFGVRFRF